METLDLLRKLALVDELKVHDRKTAALAASLHHEGTVHWRDARLPGSTQRGFASITGAGIARLAKEEAAQTTNQAGHGQED